MDRKDFIKKGALSTFFLSISGAFGNVFQYPGKIRGTAALKGCILPPIPTWWAMGLR